MKLALIGHRGVGKSSLLKRIESYLPKEAGYRCLSLDEEIEKRASVKIDEIFKKNGEAYFREIEQKIFQEPDQVNIKHWKVDFICLEGVGVFISIIQTLFSCILKKIINTIIFFN